MDMRELEMLVPTLFGLEALCAEELRRLKLPEVAAENGRVRCGRPGGYPTGEPEPAHRRAGAAGGGPLPGRRLRGAV